MGVTVCHDVEVAGQGPRLDAPADDLGMLMLKSRRWRRDPADSADPAGPRRSQPRRRMNALTQGWLHSVQSRLVGSSAGTRLQQVAGTPGRTYGDGRPADGGRSVWCGRVLGAARWPAGCWPAAPYLPQDRLTGRASCSLKVTAATVTLPSHFALRYQRDAGPALPCRTAMSGRRRAHRQRGPGHGQPLALVVAWVSRVSF